MMTDEQMLSRKLPGELPEHVLADQQEFQNLSLEQRARRLEAVCAAAIDILVARRKMGIPDPEPEQYPESTMEFLRKNAPNGRKRAAESGD